MPRILRRHSREECQKDTEYIKHQLEEDQAGERLTMGNFQARLRAAGRGMQTKEDSVRLETPAGKRLL